MYSHRFVFGAGGPQRTFALRTAHCLATDVRVVATHTRGRWWTRKKFVSTIMVNQNTTAHLGAVPVAKP